MSDAKKLTTGGQMTAFFTPPEIADGTRTNLALKLHNFQTPIAGKKRSPGNEPYLIVAEDTEYKTPDCAVNGAEIKAGLATYDVLSYQFAARSSTGEEWDGIHCPQAPGERLTFLDFMVMVLAMGAAKHPKIKLPTRIYYVGHFSRADASAFADFMTNMRQFLNNVRNTFVSIDNSMGVEIKLGDATVMLDILFRDSMLIAPANAGSLKALGELVGLPKSELHSDPAVHKHLIRNMDEVRRTDWPNFRQYAMTDAHVCLAYTWKIMDIYEELTGKRKLPVTLTSIGMDLLFENWAKSKTNALAVLGKEEVKTKKWSKKLGRFIFETVEVPLEVLSWHISFLTECYHGGCNQQYWFGPGFADVWTDFDFSSAYPTAMSVIPMPDWDNLYEETDPAAFMPTTLGFANVEFEFPTSVRFPCLPVRTPNGLIYPRIGRSYCTAPEVFSAIRLGANVKIRRGLIVPNLGKTRVFESFISECVARRGAAPKDSLLNLFWKECSNSTYGKLAQGLQERRVFDMRDASMQQLPESRITNPCFAAYVTGFTRALLCEVMNALPDGVCVFGCTTDGFLSNARQSEIDAAEEGPLARVFRDARQAITGMPHRALEAKHVVRQPLGWRTRGQATLQPGISAAAGVKTTLLAKAGIYTPPYLETVEDRNAEIVRLFLTRTPESMIEVTSKTTLREMLNYDADFVDKEVIRRLSMEYDWKRKPTGVSWSEEYQHIFFYTEPWESVHQFARVREIWEEYKIVASVDAEGKRKNRWPCLKTLADYSAFADHVTTKTHISGADSAYLHKRDGDLDRLRQQLCAAWSKLEGGFVRKDQDFTQPQFARNLESCGLKCTVADVKYATKKPFKPGSVPGTPRVLGALAQMKMIHSGLEANRFIHGDPSTLKIAMSKRPYGPFMNRVK